MRYYIDFEASEIEKKIISVGVLSEDGREFYSLVYTDDPITQKISEITDISQEDIDEAPGSDEVFGDLYDFCLIDEEMPEFINYGTADAEYVYNNFLSAVSFKEAAMLSYLYLNMYDCSDDIKSFFYVNKTISLEKLGQYFDSEMAEQNHNALDDARLLKMVYDRMKNNDRSAAIFKEYINPLKMPDEVKKVLRMNGDTIIEEYDDLDKAVQWAKSQPNDKGHKYLMNADEKIRHAARTNGKYFGFNWRIV